MKNNIYFLIKSFLVSLLFFLLLPLLSSAQGLPPIPEVGPTVCVANCGSDTMLVPCPNNCSEHGFCTRHDGCLCDSGWKGNDCSVLANGAVATTEPFKQCKRLCGPWRNLCRSRGRVYKLCWQNLLQSCATTTTDSLPSTPTCTFPCGSDSDCSFGRKCVGLQCIIPPPGFRP